MWSIRSEIKIRYNCFDFQFWHHVLTAHKYISHLGTFSPLLDYTYVLSTDWIKATTSVSIFLLHYCFNIESSWTEENRQIREYYAKWISSLFRWPTTIRFRPTRKPLNLLELFYCLKMKPLRLLDKRSVPSRFQ